MAYRQPLNRAHSRQVTQTWGKYVRVPALLTGFSCPNLAYMSEVSATDEQDVFLSVEELAERYGVTPLTVYQWNSRGGGPPFIKVGRGARYRLSDVRAWEDSNRVDPGPRKRAAS